MVRKIAIAAMAAIALLSACSSPSAKAPADAPLSSVKPAPAPTARSMEEALKIVQKEGVSSVSVFRGETKITPFLRLKTRYKEISNPEEVAVFQTALETAERLPGIADMAPTPWLFRLNLKNGSSLEFMLWPHYTNASVMFEGNTYSLYALSEASSKALSELLKK